MKLVRKFAQCHCRHNSLLTTFIAISFMLLLAAIMQISNVAELKNQRFKKSALRNAKSVNEIKVIDKECERFPPKAIVFGVTKCGTGALTMFLNAHPDIDNAPTKNAGKAVNFFEVHYKGGVNWYIRQMPCSKPDHVIVDHNPQYFRQKNVPKRIYDFNSTMKLILLIREPISRTVSQYLQSSNGRRETAPDVNTFVLDTSGKKIDTENFAVSASAYYNHLQNWLEYFPLNQILFIETMDLAKNPLKPLRELETFLGVRPYFNSENVYFNATRGFFCVKLSYKDKGYNCAGSNKGREHPQLYDTTYNMLKEYFDPLNKKLFKTIGQEFNWTTVKR